MDILKKSSFLLATTILFSLASPTFAMNPFEEQPEKSTEYYPSGQPKKKWTRADEVTEYHPNGKVKSISGPDYSENFDENGNLIVIDMPQE